MQTKTSLGSRLLNDFIFETSENNFHSEGKDERSRYASEEEVEVGEKRFE
jgi:hypothetical protein